MGLIADQFDSAFRDSKTEGVPASGVYFPKKSDIRLLGRTIEGALSSAVTSVTRFATVATMNAAPGEDSGSIAYVYANNGSTSDAANGYYQWSGSAWVAAPWVLGSLSGNLDVLDDRVTVTEDGLKEGKISTGISLESGDAFSQIFGTAQARLVGGVVRGVTYPTGSVGVSGGNGSYVGVSFGLDLRSYAGSVIRIALVVTRSTPFTRDYGLTLLVTTASGDVNRGFGLEVADVGGQRILSYIYTVQGDELGFKPFLQDGTTTPTATEEYLTIDALTVSFESTAFVSVSAADAAMERRLELLSEDLMASSIPTIYVAQSGGNFTTIAAALASITDASAKKRYRILISKRDDSQRWTLPAEITWKNWVDLEANGPDRVPISFRQADSTALSDIEQHSAFRVHHDCAFRGLDIDVENARYVFHIDDPGQIGRTVLFEDCHIEHRGNQGARDYQTSIGGNPNAVWASTSAIGMGTYSNSSTRALGAYFKAPTQPFSFHNATTPQALPSLVDLESCVFEATNVSTPIALQLNSQGSTQRDLCRLVGNKFIGVIAQDAPSFYGADPEWMIIGHGNVDVELAGNAVRHLLTDVTP